MNLDKTDLKNLENLCIINYNIFLIYEELIKLELYYYKDSNKYEELFKELKKYKIASNIILSMFNDSDKAFAVAMYLVQKYGDDIPNSCFLAMTQDINAMFAYRLINFFRDIALKDDKYFFLDLNEDYPSLIDSDSVLEGKSYLKEIIPLEEKNTIFSLFNFIQNDYANQNYDFEDYISLKYYLSFLEPVLEDEFINNKFGSIKHNFNSNLRTQAKVSDNTKNNINNYYGCCVCWEALDEILEYSDEDLDSQEYETSLTTLFNLFKSGLVFLDSDGIKELREEIIEVFDVPDMEDKKDDLIDIMTIIDDLMKDYKSLINFVNKDDNYTK